MVADEGEGDYADGLEDAGVDGEEREGEFPARRGVDEEALRDDGEDDDEHGGEREGGCFRQLTKSAPSPLTPSMETHTFAISR